MPSAFRLFFPFGPAVYHKSLYIYVTVVTCTSSSTYARSYFDFEGWPARIEMSWDY